MAVLLLIDGENLKGKIKTVFKSASKDKPLWHEYDFKGLLDQVLAGTKIDRSVFYFAKLKEHPESREKSKELIEEQRLLKNHLEGQGFEVMNVGRVRGQVEQNKKGRDVLVFREKGVDVKIEVDMVTLACDRKAEEIILASSDSDLQPAVAEVKGRGLKCAYLGFEAQPNKGLAYTTDRTILIRNTELFKFEKQPKLIREDV